MAHEHDYGYFGKGTTGYAHYSQTFNSTFPKSQGRTTSSPKSTVPPRPMGKIKRSDFDLPTIFIIALGCTGFLGFIAAVITAFLQ